MNDFIEIRWVIDLVFRRWWLIFLFTLLAAVAGYAISLQLDPVYEATTSVIVGQSIQTANVDNQDIQASKSLALSYADLARRRPILEAAITSKDLNYSWQDLRKRVKVGLVPDTQLLEISVEAGSPQEAAEIADEIAKQLVLLSSASPQNEGDDSVTLFVQQRREDLQKKIEANQETIYELRDELAQATTPEEDAKIQAEIDELESMVIDWENTYARYLSLVGTQDSTNNVAVVESAHANPDPIRPSRRLFTVIAGAIGFMLALGVIFAVEFLDDTVKTVDDIDRDLNLTPLGAVERFGGRSYREQIIVSGKSFSPVAESYRLIRNNIQYMSIDKPGKSILVTSPEPGDGKSITAVNLGIAMAYNGQNTIIVDADLRDPDLHKIFQVPNKTGLTNKLRDLDSEMSLPLIDTEVAGLQLLSAGDLPPNPSELLGSHRMEKLVAELESKADVLIFDSPPVAYIADAAALSKHVDGVVMVVSAGKTRRDITRQAVFNLQQASANILGIVINRATDKSGGSKYRYYSADDAPQSNDNRIVAGLQRVWSSSQTSVTEWSKRIGN